MRRMIIEHNTQPITAHGHANYRGYDAYVGRHRDLGHPKPFKCGGCQRRFSSPEAREQHQRDFHTGEFEP